MANWFFMFIFSFDVHNERGHTYAVWCIQLVLVQADTKHIDSWLDRICYFLFSFMVDWTEAASGSSHRRTRTQTMAKNEAPARERFSSLWE